MSGLRSQRYRRPELPLVPLIDVLVMLVLFAFVTMRFSPNRTLNITVPKVQTAGSNQFTGKLEIGIDKEGRIFANGKPIDDAGLTDMLSEVQRVNKDTPVILRTDEEAQVKKLFEILDLCRKLGLNKVVMQARK